MGRIVEMPLPRMGETMEEGRIGLIVKQPGDSFRRGETLLEVESDKTTVEVPALQDGILVEWLVTSDQMVPVESAIARIEIEGEAMAGVKHAVAPKPVAATSSAPRPRHEPLNAVTRPRASTAARAAARRSGVNLATVSGSGRNGRISRADLDAAARPARAAYHVETPHGKIFFREWQAQGAAKGHALLIHGLFADSQSFTTLGRKLAARGYRTYALDLPGHGETQCEADTVDDISAAVIAALPPVKLHVVGHSFGAVIASRLIDKALSLTLLSPAGCGEEINGEFIDAMLGAHADHAATFLGEKIPLEAQATLANHLSTHGAQLRAIANAVATGGKQRVSILAALSRAAVPVRAIFLRDDAIIPSHHVLNMPLSAAVHIMQGASHMAHWRDPAAVAGLIADS